MADDQEKNWAEQVAAELIRIAWTHPDARTEITKAVRDIWDQGKAHGFERGQQSVFRFESEIRAAMTRQP